MLQHHSGGLPHPSVRHCHLVSIGSGAIRRCRRPSQRAGLRDQFSGCDQLRHKRRVSSRTTLMRQRRPAQGRHNRNQCASGAGGNAGDFGNRHRKIQGPPFASTDPTYDRDAKFLGAPRRLPFVIKSLGAFLGARLKEIPASEHGAARPVRD